MPMTLKYEQLDQEFLSWLRSNRRKVTTSRVLQELKATSTMEKRHLSRRFGQLEDRGTLVCTLVGTTRVCAVVGEVPTTLAKRKASNDAVAEPVNQHILATNSEEFLARGGQIERLPAAWDDPESNAPKGTLPMGEGYALPTYYIDAND